MTEGMMQIDESGSHQPYWDQQAVLRRKISTILGFSVPLDLDVDLLKTMLLSDAKNKHLVA